MIFEKIKNNCKIFFLYIIVVQHLLVYNYTSMKKLAITSMYANPIHPGHIECLELSKSETGADVLWVIVNNDHQAELKRGVKSFQDENFRMKVVESLKPVDKVFLSIDQDGSVVESLKKVIAEARSSGEFSEIIFTK